MSSSSAPSAEAAVVTPAGRRRARVRSATRRAREEQRRWAGSPPPGRRPGFLWLGFFLIAPLVFIVLVSFWTYQQGANSGFVTDWTFDNYRDLFGDSTYWQNMWTSFLTSLIAVAACLVFGFPVAYFLAFKIQTPEVPGRAVHLRPGPVLDELPDALDRLDVPADGTAGRAQPGAREARHHRRAGRRVRLLPALGDARDDPALHPLHGHAALLHARPGRPQRDRGGPRPRRATGSGPSRRSSSRSRCPAS